ncbi:MAG: ATP-binding protein [Lachnospiraceae bacterium]
MTQRTFDAVTKNLDQVLAFLDSQLESWGCPLRVQLQLDVAVEELFVNIASYAYGEKTGTAEIAMDLLPGQIIEITFRDSGIPYNPLEKPDPDVTKPAEEREIGGLGIYIVKKSMDEVLYRHEDGQNILTIRKALSE